MNEPTYDLDELSITWQRLISCNKSTEEQRVLNILVVDKLEDRLGFYLEKRNYNLDELSKAYQRIASVSGSDHPISKLLLCKISEQL